MEVITNPATGDVELWVSHDAQEALVEKAVRFFAQLGRHVIIYRSGVGDVSALTCALLKQNLT